MSHTCYTMVLHVRIVDRIILVIFFKLLFKVRIPVGVCARSKDPKESRGLSVNLVHVCISNPKIQRLTLYKDRNYDNKHRSLF